VTLAFVRACGGDPEDWQRRWHETAQAASPVQFGGEAIIGNLLMTARGCVAAEVTMVSHGVPASPVATTTCATIN
jgi:hypothetical protein